MLDAPSLPAVHQVADTVISETHATPADLVVVTLFLLAWRVYPLVTAMLGGRYGAINVDMAQIRSYWMRVMMRRPDTRLLDANLIGHTLSTASFFASTNLILIAGVGGALFGGERAYRSIEDLPMLAHAPHLFFAAKLGLILACLALGLMDFIWAIRQLNYSLALTGAAPHEGDHLRLTRYADAAGRIFEGALGSFNSGVRAYYFAMAAATWLIGPVAFGLATFGVMFLLIWRQVGSSAARGIREARLLIDELEAEGPCNPLDQAETPTPIGQTTPVPPMPQ